MARISSRVIPQRGKNSRGSDVGGGIAVSDRTSRRGVSSVSYMPNAMSSIGGAILFRMRTLHPLFIMSSAARISSSELIVTPTRPSVATGSPEKHFIFSFNFIL